mmetsp:Transcript_37073/g.106023  ORF Transcript_37073/g.106023 Transcript_37073/m.106023 type:complete len:449 (+) Transcript_37073:66-1412(+)
MGLRLLLAGLAGRCALWPAQAAPGPGVPAECGAEGGGDENCPAAAAPLRWRGFPYRVSNPAFARAIYGGDYIAKAFKERGFEGPVDGDDWDVLWTHRSQDPALALRDLPSRPGRRLVNHCNHFGAAGDKCALAPYAMQLRRAAASEQLSDNASSPSEGHRHFLSFVLDDPKQFAEWTKMVQAEPLRFWLLKPCRAGASKGIRLLRGVAALAQAAGLQGSEASVAQEYLERPYMGFGGRKFHLRLYILVTRWSPTAAYLYNDGLIFRSRHPYKLPDGSEQGDRAIFSSISKGVEALPLDALWRALDSASTAPTSGQGPPASSVWQRVLALLRELLGQHSSAVPGGRKAEAHRQTGCFDLFGADVILDESLQPRLMEVNAGPNIWIGDHGKEHMDLLHAVKGPLMKQVVHWAALWARLPDQRKSANAIEGMEERAVASETEALLNFTRLL